MFRRLTAAVLGAGLAATLGGCGYGSQRNSPGAVLDDASASMAERTSGQLDFKLEASATRAGPVGFEVSGPYSFESKGDLAVLDLTYARVLGKKRAETRVVSTGAKAWTVVDGEARAIPAAQLKGLRVSGEGPRGDQRALPTLDLEAWVDGGRVRRTGDRTTVNGNADVAGVVHDLQRIAAEAGGKAALAPLGKEDAARLTRLVRRRTITVVTAGPKHELRSLRAVVDFGTVIPGELRAALGAYAGARLEVALDVDDLRPGFRVKAPEVAGGRTGAD